MRIQNRVAHRRIEDLLAGIRSAPGRIAIAFVYRDFRLLWAGAFTSSIGTWMQKVAQAWLIVTMTGSRSAFYLGLDSFLAELPLLLFTVIGGVISDRHDRRYSILMSQITQMLVALTLALLVFTRRIHIAHVLTLSFTVGCVRAFGGPAYQSLLPTLVDREHIPNAIALNAIQFNLAQVIGPMFAGAALSTFGIAACFSLNGISFLFVIAAILALRNVRSPAKGTEGFGIQLRDCLRFIQDSPSLANVMAVGFFTTFLGVPLFTFLPIVTRDVFHRDVAFYTKLMTFSGAGALTGAVIIAWLGKSRHMGRILRMLLMFFGVAIIGFGLSRRPGLSASIVFAGGALFVMSSSLATSLAQLLAPPAMLGRVVSVYLIAFLSGSPLGSIASGWLITRIGSAPEMLVINGTALTLVAFYFLIHGQNYKDFHSLWRNQERSYDDRTGS